MGRRVPNLPLYHTLAILSSIFLKKLHKILSRILCNLTIAIPSCTWYTCIIKRDRELKVKAVKKISKKLKKVLTKKTAYDIINT